MDIERSATVVGLDNDLFAIALFNPCDPGEDQVAVEDTDQAVGDIEQFGLRRKA